jgi:hypothetical protein
MSIAAHPPDRRGAVGGSVGLVGARRLGIGVDEYQTMARSA